MRLVNVCDDCLDPMCVIGMPGCTSGERDDHWTRSFDKDGDPNEVSEERATLTAMELLNLARGAEYLAQDLNKGDPARPGDYLYEVAKKARDISRQMRQEIMREA
jgi:hypothetical protein